ncbi:MAG: hypothetical protein AAGB97_03510 [Dehalococcoidia bacterium]
MEGLYDQYVGKRIVLTTCHHVSFAGRVMEQIRVSQREGLIVELDADSGFSIFCPIAAINEIIEVPIPD